MAGETNDTLNTVAGTLGGAGGLVMLFRWFSRTFHIDRAANKAADAETNVIDRLEKEIARLASIVQVQQAEIDGMRQKQARLETRLANTRAAFLAIECLIETLEVGDLAARKKLIDLLKDLISDTTDCDSCCQKDTSAGIISAERDAK